MDAKLSFPPYWIDVGNEQLWQAERQIALKPKTFAVLRYLIDRPGQLVSKDELLESLWPEVYVTDGVLKTCIREIRHALGERASQPQYIETVHRRGYRFIATFTATPPGQSQEVAPTPTPPSLIPRLVGREAELAQLQGRWQQALQGERQLVFVTGEPGIGKTTLVDAFIAQVDASSQAWDGRGQCVEQYGAGEAYLPVLEALSRLCKRAEGEELVSTLEQYAPTWLVQMPALLDDARLKKLKQKVSGSTHERMLREMAEFLEAFTPTQPLIVWFEDLHWADHSTIELLSYLARRAGPARLLVIGSYRPKDIMGSEHPLREMSQELLAKGMGVECPLELLTPEAVAAYVAGRVGLEEDAAVLGQVIHQRTEGNALFMVHVVDHLKGQGLGEGEQTAFHLDDAITEVSTVLPDGLKQLIEHQLAQLAVEHQRVLEVASVVGAEFTSAAVAVGLKAEQEEIEAVCEELIDRAVFIEETGLAEWPDGTLSGQYRFRHALYRRVLYDRIAKARRVRLHRAVGEREETGYGERAAERAAELAVHFERGRDLQRSVQYLVRAGKNAFRRTASVEAIQLLRHGLELLKTLPNSPERMQQEIELYTALGAPLMAVEGLGAPEVGQAYARARDLCQQQGESPQLFIALMGSYTFHFTRAELATAHDIAKQMLRLAQSWQLDPFLLAAHLFLGVILHYTGETLIARKHLEESLSFSNQQQNGAVSYLLDPGACVVSQLALVLAKLGYLDQAAQKNEEALCLARQLSHPYSLAYVLYFAALVHQLRGERHRTREVAEELLQLSHEYGFSHLSALGTILHGGGTTERTKMAQAIDEIRRGLALHRATGSELGCPYFLGLLAEAHDKAGQSEDGLQILHQAFEAGRKHNDLWWDAELYRLKGELLVREDQHRNTKSRESRGGKSREPRVQSPESKAEASFQQAIEIAQRQEAKSLELRATISLARLWQRQGKKAEARHALAEIYDWFTEGFDTADLQAAKALLGSLA